MIIETDSDLYQVIKSNWWKQASNAGLGDFSSWIEQYRGMVHVNMCFQHRALLSDEAGIVVGIDCIRFEQEADYLIFVLKNT